MVTLSDFIKIHNNALDLDSCNTLIDLFESNESNNNEFNLTDNIEISDKIKKLHTDILRIVINTRNEYYEYCYGKVFPDMNSFEKFVIIKTNENESDNDENVIVDIKQYSNARRFLGFKFYLNTISGGETKFIDLTVNPSPGRLLVYPPFWLFPHKECPPVGGPKYILQTYLHYK